MTTNGPLTTAEAAAHIGVRTSQIHRWIKAGVLKVVGTEEYEVGNGLVRTRYLLDLDSVEAQARAMDAVRRRRPLYRALAASPRRPYLSKK
jgi:predicted site-specific integrase-resolvase